ncbi:MAG TPA: hypothetical protein VFZ61_07955 [Polyangiales bacterium]
MANDQSAKSGKDPKQGNEQSAGGRSEQQGRQRDDEQARAGHDKSAEVPRGAVHNVKSEPHWDPDEAPAEREGKGARSSE